MARVLFGSGLFVVEAITGGLSFASSGAEGVHSAMLLVALIGAVPTAIALAGALFCGDAPAELLDEPTG